MYEAVRSDKLSLGIFVQTSPALILLINPVSLLVRRANKDYGKLYFSFSVISFCKSKESFAGFDRAKISSVLSTLSEKLHGDSLF